LRRVPTAMPVTGSMIPSKNCFRFEMLGAGRPTLSLTHGESEP
jgi:hypothetical protein